jgi:hypothetical protein
MKKYTVKEFANEIRTKHPGSYDDLSDEKLVELWLKKFPDDKFKLENEIVNITKKSNNIFNGKLFWVVLVIIIFSIIFFYFKSSNSSTPKIENFFSYNGDTIWLKSAYHDENFEEIYFINEVYTPIVDTNAKGMYLGLCHWQSNDEIVKVSSFKQLKEFPQGVYEFKKDTGPNNWKPYTIVYSENSLINSLIKDNCPDIFNCPEAEKKLISSGSKLIITKDVDGRFTFEWNLNLANGEIIIGNYRGDVNLLAE